MRSASLRWWVIGGAAGIALLLYLPTLWYGFVWDDGHLITSNKFLARTSPVEIFTKGFWHNPEKGENAGDMSYYRPLASLSFFLERREFELNPAGYHLTNLLIHVVVVVLLGLILQQLFGSIESAGIGALLLGINPATNCIVAFISNRTYLLAMFMLLASFYCLLRGQRPPAGRARPGYLWPILCGLAFLLAMLSLESALVFGAIAGGWLLLNRRQYPRLGVWFASGAAALGVYLFLRLVVAKISLMPESVARWAITQPLRVLNTFGQQLALLVFPFNQKVIYTVGPQFTDFSIYTVLGLVFLLGPLAAILATGAGQEGKPRPVAAQSAWGHDPNRLGSGSCPRAQGTASGWRLALLGYAWMVLFLLPFSNLLFLGPAGRMVYLSGPGAMIMILALVRRIKSRSPTLSAAAWALVAVCAVAFSAQLLRRNPVWRNELALDATMVDDAPDSPGAHLNLGAELAKQSRMDEAVVQYRRAIEADSNYVAPHNRLAFALVDRNELDEAVREFSSVVRLDPSSPDAHNNLALTLKRAGRIDSAIVEYQTSLQLARSDTTLNNLGRAYLAKGDLRSASAAFQQALAHNPYFAAARENLAQTYLAAGFADSAAMLGK